MGWFSFSRTEGYPTRYADQHTAAHVDVLTTGLIISLIIVAISLFVILPAYGKRKRRALFLRIFISMFIGGIVLVGNYGHNWEIGEIHMSSPYKPSTSEEIVGNIGLHISLRGINITLIGKPMHHSPNETSELEGERIDYNEHFSWEWAQGRFGFGYYAGQISKDFRAASLRGVPIPILQIAEYFTFDGEGIRFGRYYRLAGWYSHSLLWTAFGTWIISSVLSCMIVSSSAFFLILTGLLQLASIGVWTFSRNPIEIQIPFQTADGHGDILLRTKFGPDYYVVFVNGIFCILLGLVMFVLDSHFPDEMCQFFGIDPLTIYDEFSLTEDELAAENKPIPKIGEASMMEMGEMNERKKVSFHEPTEELRDSTVVLKRRENEVSKLFKRSFRVKPTAHPRTTKPSKTESSSMNPSVSGARRRENQPLLTTVYANINNSSSDDEGESHLSWPPPPSAELLRNKPPPPPPKRYNR